MAWQKGCHLGCHPYDDSRIDFLYYKDNDIGIHIAKFIIILKSVGSVRMHGTASQLIIEIFI